MSKIALSPNASGTGTFTVAAPNTNTDYTLTLPQGTGTVVANNVNSAIVSGTEVASTSGTSIDFTGIPSWAKRVTVMFRGVSTSGTSGLLVQIGSGSVQTTGYVATSIRVNNATSTAGGSSTSGFNMATVVATDLISGSMVLHLLSANSWVSNHTVKQATTLCVFGGGDTSLSGALDRVRVTTGNGTDTFDAGTINILYE